MINKIAAIVGESLHGTLNEANNFECVRSIGDRRHLPPNAE